MKAVKSFFIILRNPDNGPVRWRCNYSPPFAYEETETYSQEFAQSHMAGM